MIDQKIDDEKYLLAKKLYENGVLKPAKDMFIDLILKNPFIWQLWFALGATYQREKEYISAIKSFNLALVLDNKNASAHFHIAESFLSLDDKKNAKAHLNLASKYCTDEDLNEMIQILIKQNYLHAKQFATNQFVTK